MVGMEARFVFISKLHGGVFHRPWEGICLTVSDVECCVIITYLLNYILNIHPECISLSMGLQLLLDLGRFFSFGRTLWTGDQPVTRPLPAHRTAPTQNKRTQTSMPWVGFEPTTPMCERAKTVQASDRAATGMGPECVCPVGNSNVFTPNFNTWSFCLHKVWDSCSRWTEVTVFTYRRIALERKPSANWLMS
jgi:hypothetical protein